MKLFIQNNSTTDYEIRTTQLQGRDHWILPTVMLVEGVHNGSRGPLLYTEEEISVLTESCNGIPVTIFHPEENSEFVSANAPGNNPVGRVFNTHMEGNQLRGEIWLDVDNLREQSQEAYQDIQEHRPLDVSIGVFGKDQGEPGVFNGKNYTTILRNMQPDHLALLPGRSGACSWDDGCGIRVNENKLKGGIINVTEVKNLKVGDLTGPIIFKNLNEDPEKIDLGVSYVNNYLTENDTGFVEIMNNLRQKIDQLDNSVRIHFLEDVFDDYFVYRVHNRENGETNYFRRDYVVQQDGSIDFEGEPAQVRKETNYVTMMKRKTTVNSKRKLNRMSKTKNSPCDVNALIANEGTKFTEEHREWLESLDQEQLALLTPNEEKEETEPPKKESVQNQEPSKEKKETSNKELITENEDGAILIGGKQIADLVKDALANNENPDEFIDKFMPDGLKGNLKAGLKMYKNNRARLIKGIVENSEFTEEGLESWTDEDLQTLHGSVVNEEPEGDGYYIGPSGVVNQGDDTEDTESMIAVHAELEKKPETQDKKEE